MAEIRVEKLHKAFAEFTAVQDSSFTVRDGEFFCLLGPSGCGKTTTLRMIAGLELPTSGQIYLGNEDVSFKRASARDIAFVFQMFALYPHMNVRRNIAFPLVSQGLPRAEIEQRVDEAARILRIGELLDKPVSGLSSGDRQRVALGRAIVRQPLAFLMDEPLGALDAEFREVMCQELRALHDRLKATTVYVTHDQTEAMSMADTIAIMNRGVIEQLGAPLDVYEYPASVFVADFIGAPAMNFLPFEAALAKGCESLQIGNAHRGAGTARRRFFASAVVRRAARTPPARRQLGPARRGLGNRIPGHEPGRDARHRRRCNGARQGRRDQPGPTRRPRRPGLRRCGDLAFRQHLGPRAAHRPR